jgi:membrane protein
MSFLKTMIDLLQQTYHEWTSDRVPRLAAALSYYTIFSLAPFLIVVIAVAGLVFGREAVQGRLDEQIQGLIGAQGADMVQQLIQNVSQPQQNIVASVVGLATLLLGASGVFGQLQDTMNTVWNVPERKGRGILSTIKDRFISFTMVLGVGFLLVVSLVISAALSAIHGYVLGLVPGTETILHIINILISFGIITVLFAMIYKILPDIAIEWRDVWIGAAFTALLFTLGKFLLGWYLGNSGVLTTYGAAGSLVIILLWVFYSAQILLFGAEFTQVFAKRYGSFAEDDPASDAPEKQPAGGGPENKPVPSEG